jgi:hypothetical protein
MRELLGLAIQYGHVPKSRDLEMLKLGIEREEFDNRRFYILSWL